MAEVLGLGMTHYPPLSGRDEDMANILKGRLADPGVPSQAKDPRHWPHAMQQEWGSDEGVAAAGRHRKEVLRGIREIRKALDAFDPDFVIVWGDDQYENFKENIIPPFCVLAYDDLEVFPWRDATESAMFSSKPDQWGGGRQNVWGEGRDFSLKVKGRRDVAKEIVTRLLEREFDVSYAYEPLNHPGLAHAFLNSVLYLDYDRRGFPWPLIPFQINCYGRGVIRFRGFASQIAEADRPPDPPAPSPKRVYKLGAAVARICQESPWRVALIASSSWSHAFLNEQTYRMQPNVEFDRKMFAELRSGNLTAFRELDLSTLEATGNHELLNWCALAGAMAELGNRCVWAEMAETYVFNSSKVTAVFASSGGPATPDSF